MLCMQNQWLSFFMTSQNDKLLQTQGSMMPPQAASPAQILQGWKEDLLAAFLVSGTMRPHACCALPLFVLLQHDWADGVGIGLTITHHNEVQAFKLTPSFHHLGPSSQHLLLSGTPICSVSSTIQVAGRCFGRYFHAWHMPNITVITGHAW